MDFHTLVYTVGFLIKGWWSNNQRVLDVDIQAKQILSYNNILNPDQNITTDQLK